MLYPQQNDIRNLLDLWLAGKRPVNDCSHEYVFPSGVSAVIVYQPGLPRRPTQLP